MELPKLIDLIEELSPFADTFGDIRGLLPLESGQSWVQSLEAPCVRDWLRASAFDTGLRVEPRMLDEALSIVRGRALKKLPNPPPDGLVVRIIVQLSRVYLSWEGSAQELLGLIKRFDSEHKLRRDNERIPQSPEGLAKELTKAVIPLGLHNIVLSRPPRHAQKRLWAWQRVAPAMVDDGSDTPLTDPPTVVTNESELKPKTSSTRDSHDGLTDEQIQLEMISKGER